MSTVLSARTGELHRKLDLFHGQTETAADLAEYETRRSVIEDVHEELNDAGIKALPGLANRCEPPTVQQRITRPVGKAQELEPIFREIQSKFAENPRTLIEAGNRVHELSSKSIEFANQLREARRIGWEHLIESVTATFSATMFEAILKGTMGSTAREYIDLGNDISEAKNEPGNCPQDYSEWTGFDQRAQKLAELRENLDAQFSPELLEFLRLAQSPEGVDPEQYPEIKDQLEQANLTTKVRLRFI